jgi:hypothetical protein
LPRDKFPTEVVAFFTAEASMEFLDEDPVLRWLLLPSFDNFNLGAVKNTKNPKAHLLFMPNPKGYPNEHGLIEDDMIYAQFPGNLTASQSNWCGQELSLLGNASVFNSNSNDNRIVPTSTVCVS